MKIFIHRILSLCIATLLLQASPLFADKTNAEPAGILIGSLKTNEKIINVLSGKSGPMYTIKTIGGEILAENLSKQEAIDKFPEIKAILERGIADNAKNYTNSAPKTGIDNIDTGLSH